MQQALGPSRHFSGRRCGHHARRLRARAVVASAAEAPAVDTVRVKAFLEELKSIGSIRIITNNGLAVLESVTTFDGLFYSPTPKGEYANIIKPKENVDLHLLLPRCRAATLESAEGRGGGYTSHFCRLLDEAGTVAVTFYLMWPEGAARGAYADGQEAAFTALKAKHGARVDFAG